MIDVSRLQVQLLNTGLQNKDTPLYQFLNQLLGTVKSITSGEISAASSSSVVNNNINNQNLIINEEIVDDSIISISNNIVTNNNINNINTIQNLIISEEISDDAIIATPVLNVSSLVYGSGTIGNIPKWASINSLTDSIISESGNTITITSNVSASDSPIILFLRNYAVSGSWSIGAFISTTLHFRIVDVISGIVAIDISPTTGNIALVGTLDVTGAAITLTNASANLTVKISGGVAMTLQPGFFGTSTADGFVFLINSATAGKIHASKGFSWGDTTDPGASNARFAGTLLSVGDFSVGSSKFTVTAATGNTIVAGTLDVTGNFNVNTSKFSVIASSGNTTIAGTLAVTGNTTLTGTLAVNGATIILTNASAELQVKISGGLTMTLQPGFFGTSTNDAWVILSNNGTAGKIHASRGFSWGDTTDPGASNFRVAGTTRFVGATIHDSDVSVAGIFVLTTTTGLSLAYDNTTLNNDVSPGTGNIVRVTASSGTLTAIITGFSGGVDGRILIVINADTIGSVELRGEATSTASAAANRFISTGGFIGNYHFRIIVYDGTSSRWRFQ